MRRTFLPEYRPPHRGRGRVTRHDLETFPGPAHWIFGTLMATVAVVFDRKRRRSPVFDPRIRIRRSRPVYRLTRRYRKLEGGKTRSHPHTPCHPLQVHLPELDTLVIVSHEIMTTVSRFGKTLPDAEFRGGGRDDTTAETARFIDDNARILDASPLHSSRDNGRRRNSIRGGTLHRTWHHIRPGYHEPERRRHDIGRCSVRIGAVVTGIDPAVASVTAVASTESERAHPGC